MNVYDRDKYEPNAKASLEYANGTCVGIMMSPADDGEKDGRVGLNAMVFHLSNENAVQLAHDILERVKP